MKRLMAFIITVVFVSPVFSQDMFQQLTGKYADKDGFSAMLITNDMFDLYLRKKNIEKESPVYETLKKLDNILVASQSKFGEKAEVDVSGIHSEILDHYKKGNYTLFKTEKRMGEDVKVYLKKTNERVTSLALVTATSSVVNLVEMNGDIDLASLSDLSKTLNIRGLENLYKINGGSSYQVLGGTFTMPDYQYNFDFSNQEFFNEEKLKELQKRITEQNFFTEEQKKELEQKTKEMTKHQADLVEKYRQMAEQYGRQPIFLSYPGDTTTVYYIDGKKVSAEDVKKILKDEVQTIEVNKNEKDKNTIRITTKK